MAKFVIKQNGPLKGKVKVSGAKNAALPVMAAALLGLDKIEIQEVPDLKDVRIMRDLLEYLGLKINFDNNNEIITVIPGEYIGKEAPYELVNKMRASFLVMGPLLAKGGYAKVPLPGGCSIGTRPVDLHLKGFAAMGAEIIQDKGFIIADTKGMLLKGATIYLDFPSVGATENLIMAATLATGETVLENAATEPEIVDLSNFLMSMGAEISGAGTDTIKIRGVKKLGGASYAIMPDRIEAGTFMAAAAATSGDVTITNVITDHLIPVTAKLREAGVEVSEEISAIRVKADREVKPIDVKTLPYPGFPTDMQAQFAPLMSRAKGISMVTETIFENRFMHLAEIKRMGANVKIEGRTAVLEGGSSLTGAKITASDLRAGASLIIAGLMASGQTEITGVEHIERGYCDIDVKLKSLGADIARMEDET